ncbi:MAG TPA: hypothetical protein VEJ68_03520 [Candidatus Bathyarchaeia archaeon]|nr:hypothetical protein [Candidatus Bathyarchaeia archaeon]
MLTLAYNSVLDWQQKLNQGYGKHPAWNMNFIKVPLNMQSSFDSTSCDITMYFKSEPDNPDDQLLEAGVTYPDVTNHTAKIEVYYLGVNLKWSTDEYTQGNDIIYIYTPILYFTGYLASDPQLEDTISHELGHGFGLGHYIVQNDTLYQITQGQRDPPSIMITTGIGYGVTHYDITPLDVNEMKTIYGNNGFPQQVTTPPANTPTQNATPALTQTTSSIPKWIKNSAKWWSEGTVSDGEFIKSMQYLIQQGILKVPTAQTGSSSSQTIPTWIRINAGWWADGTISDDDFVKGIQYLVASGIVQIHS